MVTPGLVSMSLAADSTGESAIIRLIASTNTGAPTVLNLVMEPVIVGKYKVIEMGSKERLLGIRQ